MNTRGMAFVLTLFAHVALADEVPAAPTPRPPWFAAGTGSWKCEGTSTPPGAPAHPVKAKVPYKSDLGGAWASMRYEEQRTRENPMPMSVQEYYGFDPVRNSYVRVAVDATGGHFVSIAPLAEDALEFTGDAEMMGKKMPARIRFAKSGSDLKVTLSFATPDGKWMTAVDLNCRK